MSEGWIKLHRQIQKHAVYSNAHLYHLFTHLIMSANRLEGQSVRGNSVITVKRGQVLTSRPRLSRELKCAPSTIERRLVALERLGLIGQQTDSNYRIISITNYNKFQESGQRTDNDRDTNKKGKKEKKDMPEKNQQQFQTLWQHFPKQRAGSPDKACQAYMKIIKDGIATHDELLQAVINYKGSDEVKNGYACGGARYFNDHKFNQDCSKAAGKADDDECWYPTAASKIRD